MYQWVLCLSHSGLVLLRGPLCPACSPGSSQIAGKGKEEIGEQEERVEGVGG